MAIRLINEDEFSEYGSKQSVGPVKEYGWYKSDTFNVVGAFFQDVIDKDWGYVILGLEEDGIYRPQDVKGNIQDPAIAESSLYQQMLINEVLEELKQAEGVEEVENNLYTDNASLDLPRIEVLTIDDHIKAYFKKHPEKLYDLSPRKFEELVASILVDLGFVDIELTPATRDGGRDIIAYVRNGLTSFLTYIECKRYAPDNKVGVDIIRSVTGVHHMRNPSKSIIFTTGFFTKDAREEAKLVRYDLDLNDYDNLKTILARY